MESKLRTGTSKTKWLHPVKFEFSLFWMSQCVAFYLARCCLYHVTVCWKGHILGFRSIAKKANTRERRKRLLAVYKQTNKERKYKDKLTMGPRDSLTFKLREGLFIHDTPAKNRKRQCEISPPSALLAELVTHKTTERLEFNWIPQNQSKREITLVRHSI